MRIIGERDPSCLNWPQILVGLETQKVPGKVAEEEWSGGGWLFFLSV